MPRIRKLEALEDLFVLLFASRYELASTFLRFQEHYESPRFRGKAFTLEAFMDWYAAQRGQFTYYQDWGGFNLPSSVLEPFRAGAFDPLLVKERRLLDLFAGREGRFFIAGIAREDGDYDDDTLRHELAHGLYHTRPTYRRAVQAALREHDTRRLRRKLVAAGYCDAVLTDETHAYVLAEPAFVGEDRGRLAPLRRQLKRLFVEHGGQAAMERVAARWRRPTPRGRRPAAPRPSSR